MKQKTASEEDNFVSDIGNETETDDVVKKC